MLQHHPQKIAHELNYHGFKASSGWFDKFKKRHGLSHQKLIGEAGGIDEEEAEVRNLIPACEATDGLHAVDDEGLSTSLHVSCLENDIKDQSLIYNMDKFGFFYAARPNSTYALMEASLRASS